MSTDHPEPVKHDALDSLLERAVTVRDVGGRNYVLRAPTDAALNEVDAYQRLPEDERPPLWPLLLFSKCLHHTVNAEASGLRERSESEWLGILNAAGAVPELDLARLVVASQRLFGFTAQASADDDDADVVDHADETEERLGQLPS